MKAKTYLSQAWLLEQRVRSKLQQMASLRSLAEQMYRTFGPAPVSKSRNVSAMEDTILRIQEAELELNRRIDHLVDAKREIAAVIDEVEDVKLRLILEKRYLTFMTWEQIAVDLHYTLRWTLQRHNQALEAVQEILDREKGEG